MQRLQISFYTLSWGYKSGTLFDMYAKMPRAKFICDPEMTYQVTNRSINRDWFAMPMEQVWEIFENELFFVKHAFDLQIFCFVLMSNHFHLLVRAPEMNLSEAVAFLEAQAARQIVKGTNRINHLWAHRFKRSALQNQENISNVYKYILQNPLRAGIIQRVENYRFSTLHGVLGKSKLVIPVEEDQFLFEGKIEDALAWLNELPPEESNELIRRGLRRVIFEIPRIGTRKPSLKI